MAAEIAGENLSSSKPTLSQAPKNGSSGEPTASGPDSTSLVRKATGPRTERGKSRSRHNAIKHAIFSKVVVLKRESQGDFDAFHNALREDYQPKGAQEEILVNVLAVLWWRLLRTWAAETAEIQSGMEFLEWDANERNRQDAARLPQLSCNGGLIRWIANPEALQGCLNLLEDLKASLNHEGFNAKFDKATLTKLYGSREERGDTESWQKTLFDSYLAWFNASKGSDEEREQNGCASPQKCKENFLEDVNEEIRRLEGYRKEHVTIRAFKLELESLRRSVPEGPRMDQLLRYETTIFREIGHIQNQLERLQRVRLGQQVPPPISLNVTAP